MLKLMFIVLDDTVFLVRKKICDFFFSAVAIKGYLIIAVGNLSFLDFGTYNLTIPVYFLNYDLIVPSENMFF